MPEEIRIADIAKELERQCEQQQANNQMRASLFNLILYSHEKRRAAYLQDFVGSIVEKFPCRIIFIQGDRDPDQNYLRVSVSSIVTTKGEMSIACDQIQIEVSASQMARVPFIILPHLISDLPVYLLWGQDPTRETELLPHLKPYAERLIFDSESMEDLPYFSKAILDMMGDWNMEISDLNWIVISSWRDAIARIFDSEEKVRLLQQAKNIRIVYNGAKTEWITHPALQAVYLQAWLAAQMGWKLKDVSLLDAGRAVLSYGQTIVELIPQADKMTPPGALLSIEVQSGSEDLFHIARREYQPQLIVHLSTAVECAMPFTLPLKDSKRGSTFLRDVLYRGAGCHYRQTLDKLYEMGGFIEGKL
ncbi:MAG: glucose-6-phosphate dehydrogenase assembly protein OpcA [Parachlamydia sp.]|nr:glucose-6-phosphate dehydrogenase assembly protein OpcA [Parachlamydia sp.]